jgi:hypothetical protein
MRRFVLFSLLLAGCAAFGIHSMKSEMESWIGHDQSEIMSKWGAPVRSADLPNGSKVLTWTQQWNNADEGEMPTMATCSMSFTFSPQGIATAWSAMGCPSHYIKR